jgi:hypothetical protein
LFLARAFDHLEIQWARKLNDLPETGMYPMYQPLVILAKDANGVTITGGPDASLAVSVQALALNSANALDVDATTAVVMCESWISNTVTLVNGRAQYPFGVCRVYDHVALEFSATGSNAVVSTERTIPFPVTGTIRSRHACLGIATC